jgi:hypothetical protein
VEGATDRHQVGGPAGRRHELLRSGLEEHDLLTRSSLRAAAGDREQIGVDVDADHLVDVGPQRLDDEPGTRTDVE